MAHLSIAGPVVTFWGMRKMPYYCPICGDKFGNTKVSRAKQRQHFQTIHPEFFGWNNRFGKVANSFAVGSFIYVGRGYGHPRTRSLCWNRLMMILSWILF